MSACKYRTDLEKVGSKTKVIERAEDALDRFVFANFPASILRRPKKEFYEWLRNNPVPMTEEQRQRMLKIRRMFLSRVYAERSRVQNKYMLSAKMDQIERIINDNKKQHAKIAKLEKTIEEHRKLLARLT